MDVLVLNHGYQPLKQITWQRAFTLLFSGRCEILEEYQNKIVHSAHQIFKVPSVIRFLSKQSSKLFKQRVSFCRKNVWLRDHGICQYCLKEVSLYKFTYDHVIPLSRNGPTRWENIVVSCISCNRAKGNKTPEEAGMPLLMSPQRPKSLKSFSLRGPQWADSMPETWKFYIA